MELEVCRSAWSKARGLMFSKKRNLVFEFDKEVFVPLHMFFVFFPIDVYYLDSDKRIVEIKKNFKPFAYYRPKKKAKYVIEISDSSVDKKIGDKLDF